MSYEGYEQRICEDGHLWYAAESWAQGDHEICPACGKAAAFINPVDDTNCDGHGAIPEELLVVECTNDVLGEIRYRIPTEEQANRMRVYTDPQGFYRFCLGGAIYKGKHR